MATEENKTIINRMFDEIFHQGNLAAADNFIASDVIYHPFPPTFPAGPDGFRFVFQMLVGTFPDQHIAIDDIIAEGDKVVVRSTFSGTRSGPLLGFPPTGKHCTQSQISIFRLINGKVSEYWFNADDLGMIRQLGLLPGPTG
ncbi:MAG: ester cyclase [Ktedonobacteraceae bacterium]|nr:ester cyclase [Ktedonobacteraceae bacterium]